MQLIDFNQIMIAQLFQSLGEHTNSEIDENMLRHMILNKIRYLNVKFRNEYGKMVICCDGKNTWRKQAYPYYKANRKKSREESEIDWGVVYSAFDNIRNELMDYFPYKVIHMDGCEADDIIGTLCHHYGTILNNDSDKILILSSDKDFIQLHTYGNVSQYSPAQSKWVVHSDPEGYLREHIFKGDTGDGIPNVLSKDSQLVEGIRQKPITKKRLERWSQNINDLTEEEVELGFVSNIERNTELIDLSCIPKDIQYNILEEFEKKDQRKGSLMTYFTKHDLRLLTESIEDF